MRCKFCNSRHVIKNGTFKGTQQWQCKKCRHAFHGNGALPKMRIPVEQIITAFKLRTAGLSLRATRKRLIILYDDCSPSISTICEWERNPKLQLLKLQLLKKPPLELEKPIHGRLVSCIQCGCEWEVGKLLSCPHCSR